MRHLGSDARFNTTYQYDAFQAPRRTWAMDHGSPTRKGRGEGITAATLQG